MAVPVVDTGGIKQADSGGSTVNSLAVAIPDSLVSGDIWLMIAGNDNSGSTADVFDAITTPDAFVKQAVAGDATSDCKVTIFYRVADGTESSTVSANDPGTAHEAWRFSARITGVDNTSPIDVTGTEANVGSAGSLAITEVETTQADCLAVYGHAFDGGDGDPFSVSGTGWAEVDEAASGTTSPDAAGSWGTKDQATAGLTGDATVSNTSNNDGHTGIIIAFAPDAGGPTPVSGTATYGVTVAINRSTTMSRNAAYTTNSNTARATTFGTMNAGYAWSAAALAGLLVQLSVNAALAFSATTSRAASLVASSTYQWAASVARLVQFSVKGTAAYSWAGKTVRQAKLNAAALYKWAADASAQLSGGPIELTLTATYALGAATKRQAQLAMNAAYTWTASTTRQAGLIAKALYQWAATAVADPINVFSVTVSAAYSLAATTSRQVQLSREAAYSWSANTVRKGGVILTSSYVWSAKTIRTLSATLSALYKWAATSSAIRAVIVSVSAGYSWAASTARQAGLTMNAPYQWSARVVLSISRSLAAAYNWSATAAVPKLVSVIASAAYSWSSTVSFVGGQIFTVTVAAAYAFSATATTFFTYIKAKLTGHAGLGIFVQPKRRWGARKRNWKRRK